MTTLTALSTRIATLRDEFRKARQARSAHQAMRSALAQYSTPAERLELSAVLRRHTPERAAHVRSFLQP
jgi:hypothetical protein